ncbi:hypothetical protein GCM10017673_53100 [Streptosporangium violaceochromogenes]|nr:hypothetical protein GCM10017673_53100 [Streptosporangium violaceochromogenes]
MKSPHIGEIIDSGKDPRSGAVYLISPHYQPGGLDVHAGDRNGGVSPSWSTWVPAGPERASAQRVAHPGLTPPNVVPDDPDGAGITGRGMSRLRDDGMTHLPGETAWFTGPDAHRRAGRPPASPPCGRSPGPGGRRRT